ncbi:Rrf2 family transcriptional regulator [Iodidimonas gelatinilytica]|uniref:Rrf2 family transcriptional regulator n=1 Tax=Iodidimonas gelatinilytica TaxID=1236966 RepID=A0A5A7MXC1_9PROT|nr:Rrf2 family transcriptional regulator [Iodidimonas gelatinilytica]GEQ99086.1 Rrf2 family transcriptional regulator [Iodidimonas gelatinilytica]GER00731.1 Rrf2 family transcriptional regulator [Iodidimonas gelatinilytica]
MQLTTFTDFGMRSLMYLASSPEKKCSVREIADHYSISRNHLVKVVHKLAQLGYILSTKGKGGGIALAPHSTELKLGDIVQSLEPSMDLVECFDASTNSCKITESCQLKHYLFEANNAFIQTLNKYTLADAVQNKLEIGFKA